MKKTPATKFSPVLLVGLVIVLIGLTYVLSKDNTDTNSLATGTATPTPSPSATTTPSPTATATATPDPYAGWNTYQVKDEGFSFKYPAEWKNFTFKIVPSSQSFKTYYESSIDNTVNNEINILGGDKRVDSYGYGANTFTTRITKTTTKAELEETFGSGSSIHHFKKLSDTTLLVTYSQGAEGGRVFYVMLMHPGYGDIVNLTARVRDADMELGNDPLAVAYDKENDETPAEGAYPEATMQAIVDGWIAKGYPTQTQMRIDTARLILESTTEL